MPHFVPVPPILGAHTDPSIAGMAVAHLETFNIPELDIIPVAVSAF